jgi:hypothetical protein
MKYWIYIFLALTFLSGCSSSDSQRDEIISWAKQITSIETRLGTEILQAEPIINRVTKEKPSQSDLKQLIDYNNNVISLCNDLNNIVVPSDAKITHDKYVENYNKISDSVRYYVLLIQTGDVSYYDKSVSAAQEANKIGNEAFNLFQDLLDQYSISCEEIDYCE